MEKINLPTEFKKDFLSADGKTALSGLGYIFSVGDYVTHVNEDSNEKALIQQFGRDLVHEEIYAVTDLGSAPLVSLKKFESVNNFMEISNFEQALAVDILQYGHAAYVSSGEEFYLPWMIFKKDKDKWYITKCPRLYTERELYIRLSNLFDQLKDNPSLEFETWYNEYLNPLPESLDFYDLLHQEKLI